MEHNPIIANFTYQKTDTGIEITGVADADNLVSSPSKRGLLIIPNQADLQKAGLITEDQRAEISRKSFQEIMAAACYNGEINAVAISDTNDAKLTYNSPSMYDLFDSPAYDYPSPIHGLYLNHLDTSQVVEMDYLFDGNLASKITDLEISNWDTSNVKSMYHVFDSFQPAQSWKKMYPPDFAWEKPYPSKSFVLDLSNWDVSNVTDMSGMFMTTDVDKIDISNWDTSRVEDMSYMFGGCSNLQEIVGIEDLDTSHVKDMRGMFDGFFYKGLEKLDLSQWNVSNVRDMANMFSSNYILEELNVSGWNVSRVTNMTGMFDGAKTLERIIGHEDWDVSNVRNMSHMFLDTKNLQKLDMSKWKIDPACDLKGIILRSGVRKIKTPETRKKRRQTLQRLVAKKKRSR